MWLWDLRTGKRVRTYRTDADFPEYAFSPDITKVAITGERLHLYPLDSEEQVDGFQPPENAAYFAPRFAGDGKTLFVVQQDGGVLPLDAATGEAKEEFDAPGNEPPPAVRGSPPGPCWSRPLTRPVVFGSGTRRPGRGRR